MSDVQVLLYVTAIVVAGLVIWVAATLIKAPSASATAAATKKPPTEKAPAPASPAIPAAPAGGVKITDASDLEVAAPSERGVLVGGKEAPVVVMPVIRHRLDSHREIQDTAGGGVDIIGGGAESEASAVSPSTTPPPSGTPLLLVSAIGRSDPAKGPAERSAIVDRHRLFLLADGRGARLQHELVSAILVDAIAAAFGADIEEPQVADPSLPLRADRLRRSVVAALEVVKGRAQADGVAPPEARVLAAHFAPDNRSLYLAGHGPDRAYRLRGTEIARLTRATDDGGVEVVSAATEPDDLYVFGSDLAFLALGDELRTVLTHDTSIERVAAHFVEAGGREAKGGGLTAIVVKTVRPRPSQIPPAA